MPAGGDEPDREKNPKFDHKLRFVDEMTEWSRGLDGHAHRGRGPEHRAAGGPTSGRTSSLLKVVSHTPVETDGMMRLMEAGGWQDTTRTDVPEPEKIYSWWSYRAKDWAAADKGRRLDHIWVRGGDAHVPGSSRILKGWRGKEKPSDHAPVLASVRF